MDDLWGLALSNLTSVIIVGLMFIILALVAFLVLLKFRHVTIFKRKVFKAPGVSKRLLAFCLDYLVLNIVAVLILLIFLLVLPDAKVQINDYVKSALANDWFLLKYDFNYAQYVLLGVYCFYSMVAELSSLRGTVAMNRTDLTVVDMNGEKPKLVQLFTRNLLKYGVIVYWPFFILFVYMNPNRRWIHEIVSGTKTVEL